uniref:Uncharacterized protein n=1 Tax=Gouania willdenowi TaxID=441366 RepID=A0A8C5I5Z1_GOUWI
MTLLQASEASKRWISWMTRCSSDKVGTPAWSSTGSYLAASIWSSALRGPPPLPLILTYHGSLIYQKTYKERLDRVRSDHHHSINPCDYPRLQGVWEQHLCVCVCVCLRLVCGHLSLTL